MAKTTIVQKIAAQLSRLGIGNVSEEMSETEILEELETTEPQSESINDLLARVAALENSSDDEAEQDEEDEEEESEDQGSEDEDDQDEDGQEEDEESGLAQEVAELKVMVSDLNKALAKNKAGKGAPNKKVSKNSGILKNPIGESDEKDLKEAGAKIQKSLRENITVVKEPWM